MFFSSDHRLKPSSRTGRFQSRLRRIAFERLEERTLLSINAAFYRYDGASTGLNASEVVLSSANVIAGSFGKQFTTAVDGQVLAQPLFMGALNITAPNVAGTHNVAFVATEHDSLYAIDADNGQILWHDAFATSTSGTVITTASSADVNSGDITPEIGITGTPAIDTANGYLYLVAKTKEVHNGDAANPHYVNALYKVNVHDGTSSSAVIADTTANSDGSYTFNSGPYTLGTGDGSINAGGQNRVYFNALRQMFRPAVALVNGQVVLGSGSHGDNGPYHGWMLSFNATTLAPTGVFNATPNGGLGGIWQGGDSIVTDPQGFFYFETGNGSFNQAANNFNAQGFPIDGDYGDSFVKVAVDAATSQTNQNVNGWGLKVVDYFTPYNQASLNGADTDLGSGGPMVLPDSAGSTAHPHLLVGGGKQGSIYLLDRSNLGKFNASTDVGAVQELANAVGGILSTPAYFNGKVYITSGYNGPINSYTISNAVLTASNTTSDNFGNLDGSPIISSDGAVNGIVWGLERGSGQLRAYSATNLGSELYNSSTLANSADSPGAVMKFSVPTVANAHVYIGNGNALVSYALNAPPTTAPNAPSSLTATSISGSEVSLAWTDNSNNETIFSIERSTNNGAFAQVGTAGVNQTAYVDNSVLPFTTYAYRVRAGNIIGNSAYTNSVTAVTLGQPAIGGGDGLRGQYYAGTSVDFTTATPLLTRVDPSIDYNWSAAGPATIVGQSYYEVRWTGEVQAQFSEAYTFSTISDDGVRLYINGQLVIDNFTNHGATLDTSSSTVLQAGKSYAIELDYFQGNGDARIQLGWSSTHSPPQAIPRSQLFSGMAPAAPSSLQTTPISGTQATLTWTTNSTNEDGYEVDRKQGNSGTFAPVAFLAPGAGQFLDTGLTQGTTYTYQVRATNFVANSTWSNQSALTMPVPPEPISSSASTAVATNSIALSWTNNAEDATVIRVFRIVGQGNPIFVASLPDSAETYTDTGPGGRGLTPGVSYTYRVQCGNLAGFSAYSAFSVQTLTVAPSQLLAVPANGRVTLSWLAPVGAQSFNIYRGTAPGGESATPLATGVTSATYSDLTATNGTPYYYRVSAVDTGGESAASAESFALPLVPIALPSPPPGITATPGDRSVVLTWQAAAGADTYIIYRGTTSGSEVLRYGGLSNTSFTDTGLSNGTTYYYQLAAVNQLGASVRSGELSAAPHVTVPLAPINVTATPGNSQVSLSWSAAGNALSYNIYRSTDAGNEVLYEQGILATSFIDTNATNGTAYYYQVSAGNGIGESNLSLEVSAAPLPPLPAAPSTLIASAINSAQIRLTWTQTSGTAASFAIQRSTDGVNFTPLNTLDGAASIFVDSGGLTPGLTYSYRISATNLAGSSAWSNVAANATPTTMASPWADADIGGPAIVGSAYAFNGSVFLSGSGNDIWNNSDQFHFVYVPFSGDGTIVARVGSQGNTDGWAKSGLMFRNALAANSAWAMMAMTPSNGAAFQTRDASGNLSNSTAGGYSAPGWVKLVRSGSTFTGYASNDNITWNQVGSTTVSMNAALYIGLCDTSHNNGLSSAATFSQISINGSATPTAPSGLAASAPNGTSVSLAWTNIDNFRFGNQVYRQSPNSTTYSWVATLPSNATSYLDTGLTPGAVYSYQILTTNTVGNSAASNAAAIATPIAPLAVSQLQPSSIATTSAALNWILNSANNTGVQIMRRAGGVGSFALVATLSGSPTTYTDTGLQSGVLYEYRVSATNSAGSSPAADTGLTTLPLPPIAGATANAGQIQLNWTAANGAVAYNIYRGLTPSGEGASPYASVNGAVGFTDAGITTAHAYYYRITAVDFSGESAPSAEVSAAIAQTLTSVSNNPTSVTLAAGASQQFTGAANDQFGSPLSVQPALTWTLIGGGSLNNSGLYTPPYANGSASVRVANGSLLGTASVTFTGQAQWNSGSDGTWTTNGNWKDTSSGATIAAPGLRGVIGDTILLGQATARTIRLDGTNPTIAAMLIDSSSSYTVSQGSGGSLHLANGGSGASIVVSSGSHTIGAPIALDGSVAIGPILGSSLTVSGPISGVGSSVTLADRGTLILAGVNTFGGGTIINSGKLIVSASTALPTGSALAIGPGGTLTFDPLPVTAATASALARAADSVFGGW